TAFSFPDRRPVCGSQKIFHPFQQSMHHLHWHSGLCTALSSFRETYFFVVAGAALAENYW
ncbi:hypothetical protein, partial [Desulfovibrio falkowii]|uniref:hypothetical protein n=1 Tax=Desulfovibrio falkowii TaxID=3136602 RepID=UPI0038B3F987